MDYRDSVSQEHKSGADLGGGGGSGVATPPNTYKI